MSCAPHACASTTHNTCFRSPSAIAQVQTEKESKGQALVAVGLGAFFLAAFAVGYSLDPPY